jgi:hypothetical protein
LLCAPEAKGGGSAGGGHEEIAAVDAMFLRHGWISADGVVWPGRSATVAWTRGKRNRVEVYRRQSCAEAV